MSYLERLQLYPLEEAWTPPRLLVREQQLRTLMENVESEQPSNYWVYGGRGLGKTLVARMVQSMGKSVYLVPCQQLSFKQSIRGFVARQGLKVKSTSDPLSTFLEFVDEVAKEGRITVFFDDVDRLGGYIRRDFNVFLWSLYDEFLNRGLKFSLNCISTIDYGRLETIFSASCLSRLKFKPLNFPPYTKAEIEELLRQRLTYIDGLSVDEKALSYVSEAVADMDGDFRMALDIVRQAVISKGRLSLDGVEEAHKERRTGFYVSMLKSMPYQCALMLACIVQKTLERHAVYKQPVEESPLCFPVAWEDVKRLYADKCRVFKYHVQRDAVLYYYIEQLWIRGWIDKFTLARRSEYNYTGKRGLFLRLKEDVKALIPAIRKIDWSERW